MPDAVSAAVHAVTAGSAAATILVFLAGVLSSFGPCTVTRLVAVAGISTGSPPATRARTGIAFTAGLVTMYVGFGAVTGLLGGALRFTHAVYFAVAAGCLIAGTATLLRGVTAEGCRGASHNASGGGAFLLGASFAFVISPCCTPVLAALLAYGAQSGNAPGVCLLFAAFGFGHALPVVAAALVAQRLRQAAEKVAASDALRVVTGGLLLSMAGYYGCLA